MTAAKAGQATDPTADDVQPTPDQKRYILQEFYRAYAVRDVDAMMHWFTPDIVEDLSGIGIVSGTVDERAFLNGLFAAFPDLTTTLTRVVVDADGATVEWYRHGTFTGANFQGLVANGSSFTLRGGAFFDFSGQKIRKITGYYDTSEFARGIGFLPSNGSTGERFGKSLFNLVARLKRICHRVRSGA